jgi:two-component sensor histidine kinase
LPYDNDKILVARGTGIYLCDKNGKPVRFYDAEELQQQDFQDIAIDLQGRWLSGGHLGISVVDKDSVKLFGNNHSIYTTTLCIDNQNNVWSASANRLNLLSGDSLVTVCQFPEDPVQAIYAVDNDHLIISTIHCIYFFNKTVFLNSGQCQLIRYNHNNGFIGLNPQVNGIFSDSKGRIWLPCADMLVRFEPKKLLRKQQAPVLHILSTKISTDNVKWSDAENNKFSYRQKNLQFSFIGINFSAAENVRYYYRLKGFQDGFSEPAKQMEVTFNNLLPGVYTFEIYADAGTDDSKSGIQSFSFTIKPAFWQTAWFPAILILSLMTLSSFISLRVIQRKNRILIEKLDTERQLNELKISSIRLKAIPHFNANVLAVIQYYITTSSKDEAERILGLYSKFMSDTLREVDKASRSLSGELEYVKMYLELEKLRFRDKFDYSVEIGEDVDAGRVQLPNMILHTWAENAVKHGLMPKKSGGLLTVMAMRSGNTVRVSVEDNGVGRYVAGTNRNIYSTKQGLSILERQVEIYNRFNEHKIKLLVDDLIEGTRFSIEMPEKFEFQIKNWK